MKKTVMIHMSQEEGKKERKQRVKAKANPKEEKVKLLSPRNPKVKVKKVAKIKAKVKARGRIKTRVKVKEKARKGSIYLIQMMTMILRVQKVRRERKMRRSPKAKVKTRKRIRKGKERKEELIVTVIVMEAEGDLKVKEARIMEREAKVVRRSQLMKMLSVRRVKAKVANQRVRVKSLKRKMIISPSPKGSPKMRVKAQRELKIKVVGVNPRIRKKKRVPKVEIRKIKGRVRRRVKMSRRGRKRRMMQVVLRVEINPRVSQLKMISRHLNEMMRQEREVSPKGNKQMTRKEQRIRAKEVRVWIRGMMEEMLER